MESSSSGKIAVSLGSSFLGVYAHAGFLAGLEEAGIAPHRIAGASAGALAGAFFGIGLRGEELKRTALDPALRWSFADPGMFWRLPGVLSSLWSSGLFSGVRAVRHLRGILGERNLSTLPLDIAVTDAKSHHPIIMREGPLAELVMASCAVPALFTIQNVGAGRYLDGGIANETPFEHWLDDPEIGTILIHRIRHEKGSGPTVNWETVSTSISIAHDTACSELHRHRLELARLKGKRVIEVETLTPFPGLFSQKRAPLCHERGYQTGRGVRIPNAERGSANAESGKNIPRSALRVPR